MTLPTNMTELDRNVFHLTGEMLAAAQKLAEYRASRKDMRYCGSEVATDPSNGHPCVMHFFASYGVDSNGKRTRVRLQQP